MTLNTYTNIKAEDAIAEREWLDLLTEKRGIEKKQDAIRGKNRGIN